VNQHADRVFAQVKRSLPFLAVFLLIGFRGAAQWPGGGTWDVWYALSSSQGDSFVLDLNNDGVGDLRFHVFQLFEGVTSFVATVQSYWDVTPMGRSQLLRDESNDPVTQRPQPLRLTEGMSLSLEFIEGGRWTVSGLELGSAKNLFKNPFGPPSAIEDGSGPFAVDDGFIGVLFETLQGQAVGWVEIPHLFTGFWGWPGIREQGFPDVAPAVGFGIAGGPALVVGQPGYFPPRTATRSLAPLDVNGDGIIDYAIERSWAVQDNQTAELLQIAIRGENGSHLLALKEPAGTAESWETVHHREYSDDGQSWTNETPGISIPPLVGRNLVEPQGRPALSWDSPGNWAVLWQRGSGGGQGPLASTNKIWLGGKLFDQSCGWIALDGLTNEPVWGGFTGLTAMVGETGGDVVSRLDLNDDGLVDLLEKFSGPDFWLGCGGSLAIEVLESGLIPFHPGIINISDTNVVTGTLIPADRDLYQPDPWAFLVGGLYLRYTECEGINYSLGANYIPFRIQSQDGWHAGWIGYAGERLRYAVHPVAGEPIPAGATISPPEPVSLHADLDGQYLILSWPASLLNPAVLQQTLDGRPAGAIYDDDRWPSGARVPLDSLTASSFFRVKY
jgi:hypothetical protein